MQPEDTPNQINITIQGHPSPAKLVRLPDDLAQWFAHLALHRQDLAWAAEFLDECERHSAGEKPDKSTRIVRTALWHAALNSTMKCFSGSEARVRLRATEVFGSGNDVRQAFDYLKNLRDKHVSHDDNDWLQEVPMAIIGTPGYEPKATGVQCMLLHVGSDSPANIERLRKVIDTALAWVVEQFDAEATNIGTALQHWDYDTLLALPDVSGTLGWDGSIGDTRN